jgi:hypothetical protein
MSTFYGEMFDPVVPAKAAAHYSFQLSNSGLLGCFNRLSAHIATSLTLLLPISHEARDLARTIRDGNRRR